VTFGDPLKNFQQFGPGTWGSLPKERTLVFCNSGDGVCGGAFSISAAHLSYTGNGNIQTGVNFVSKTLDALGNGPLKAAAPPPGANLGGLGGIPGGGAPGGGAPKGAGGAGAPKGAGGAPPKGAGGAKGGGGPPKGIGGPPAASAPPKAEEPEAAAPAEPEAPAAEPEAPASTEPEAPAAAEEA